MIHTLGTFDIVDHELSLVRENAGSKKIWELFKFLLSHKDQTFTPEALVDHLWVSESYSDPRSTLRRQMHRLRQALHEASDEATTILFESGYYRWNTDKCYEIDAEVFESYVQKAEVAQAQGDMEKAYTYFLEALELYKGDYLPDCVDQHWVFSIRYHYKRIYLKAVMGAVELLKSLGDHEKIVSICQKAMKIDIYEEPFHIYYMEALAQRGDFKQALEHYEHITGFYYREMGIKPTEELKKIYKSLLQSNKGENVIEVLQTEEPIENAFYCEAEVFKSIYELQKRRSQRSGEGFSVGVLELPKGKYGQPSPHLSELKKHLLEHLRKGDTLSQWSLNQVVLLLPSVNSNLFEKVLSRVMSHFPYGDEVSILQISETLPEMKPFELQDKREQLIN